MQNTSTYRRVCRFALFALSLGLGSTAHAAPTLYPRPESRIEEVVNHSAASVLADSQDPSAFYVLPPGAGTAEATNTFFTANIGFCDDMASLQSTSELLSQRREELLFELFDAESAIGTLKEEIAQLVRIEGQMEALLLDRETVRRVEDYIRSLEDAVDDLDGEIAACPRRDDACLDPLYAELDQLEADLSVARRDLRNLKRADPVNYRNYERARANREAAQAELRQRQADVDSSQLAIAAIVEQLDQMYERYTRIEGAFATVSFDTGWEQALHTLRGDNPSFSFAPIPTQNVRAFLNLVPGLGTESYLSQRPATLSLSVNGQTVDTQSFEQSLPGLPLSFVGSARLSLVGACPMHAPELFDLELGENGLPLLGMSATFDYPSAFKTSVRATYNQWRVYEYLKSVSSRGGFFRTRTSVSISETLRSGSIASFEWFDEGGVSEERKQAIEDQIRLDLAADVLRVMGVPAPDGRADAPAPTGDSGAMVVSQGLMTLCGATSYWCSGISFALRGLQSIFGGTQAETSYRSSTDYSATRDYSADQLQLRSAMTTWSRPR